MKIALCAIAKNENLYIREWVEYYKNLGISKVFLYDNNDIDGETFDEVINDYIQSNFVEVIDVRGLELVYIFKEYGCEIQQRCLIDCYKNRVSDFDWVFFCDIDEFLTFKDRYTLELFLNQEMFNDTDTILIPWVHYDDNNLVYYDNRPVVERFTHISKQQWYATKPIVRTNKKIYDETIFNMIHCFRLKGDNIKFANGQKLQVIDQFKFNWYLANPNIVDQSKCVLNHYKTKTVEEYFKRHLNRIWPPDDEFRRIKKKPAIELMNTFFKYCEKTDDKLNYIYSKIL